MKGNYETRNQKTSAKIQKYCEDFASAKKEINSAEDVDDNRAGWTPSLKIADKLFWALRVDGLMRPGQIELLGLSEEARGRLSEAARDYSEHLFRLAGNYDEEFEKIKKKAIEDPEYDIIEDEGAGRFAREVLKEDGWVNSDQAFGEIVIFIKAGLLRANDFLGLRNFLRKVALGNIKRELETAERRTFNREKIALVVAEEYEKMGILSLEEDADLFESLTRPDNKK